MPNTTQMFASVFRHAAIGMAVVSPRGAFISVNDALCRMVGRSAEDLALVNLRDITPPEDLHVMVDAVAALRAGQPAAALTTRYLHRSGRALHAQVNVSAVHADDGSPAFYVLQVQDVTEELARARALEQLEERWNFALQGSREGVWDWSPQTGELYVSQRWKDILGYADEDVIITPEVWMALVHPEDRPTLLPLYTEHAEQGTDSYESEHRMQRRDGTWLWVLLRGRVSARDADGVPLRVTGTLKDIDARVRTQLDLHRARRDLQSILDHLPAMIGYWDAQGRNRFGNAAYVQWFGQHPEHMRGRHIREVIGDALYTVNRDAIEAALGGTLQVFERDFIDAQGQGRSIHTTYVPDVQGGEVQGFFALAVDITERRRAEVELRAQREWAQTTLRSIGDGVITTDAAGHVTFMNPVAEDMTGWTQDRALGHAVADVMDLWDDSGTGRSVNPLTLALRERRVVGMALDTVLRSATGQEYGIADSAAPILGPDGQLLGGVIVFHDVSETRAMAIRMSHLAQHDALTDLPNRVLLHDRVTQALAQHRRNGTPFAVMFMDLDHFKLVNDSLGHQTGDRLLQQVAARLTGALRETDTVSRQGGDEFVILLADVQDSRAVQVVVDRLLEQLHAPYTVDDHTLNVTFSAGIAVCPADGADVDTLLRHADAAMYRAKAGGRRRAHFFSAEILHAVEQRVRLERQLRDALRHGAFTLHFQPKVDARRGVLTGFEALVRWHAPDGTLVPPGEFIPVAEDSGLIVPLGEWVLETACAQARAWQTELGVDVPVSVNISSPQFAHRGFLEHVEATLRRTRLPPPLLELEITESLLVTDTAQAAERLRVLRELGVRVSIDDFGTGYSSLSYLKLLPVDTLKIDRSFVQDLTTDRNDHAIVNAVIGMADALGLQVMAEGVETEEQVRALLDMGCPGMQGYHFARPMPADGVPAWLRAWRARPPVR